MFTYDSVLAVCVLHTVSVDVEGEIMQEQYCIRFYGFSSLGFNEMDSDSAFGLWINCSTEQLAKLLASRVSSVRWDNVD